MGRNKNKKTIPPHKTEQPLTPEQRSQIIERAKNLEAYYQTARAELSTFYNNPSDLQTKAFSEAVQHALEEVTNIAKQIKNIAPIEYVVIKIKISILAGRFILDILPKSGMVDAKHPGYEMLDRALTAELQAEIVVTMLQCKDADMSFDIDPATTNRNPDFDEVEEKFLTLCGENISKSILWFNSIYARDKQGKYPVFSHRFEDRRKFHALGDVIKENAMTELRAGTLTAAGLLAFARANVNLYLYDIVTEPKSFWRKRTLFPADELIFNYGQKCSETDMLEHVELLRKLRLKYLEPTRVLLEELNVSLADFNSEIIMKYESLFTQFSLSLMSDVQGFCYAWMCAQPVRTEGKTTAMMRIENEVLDFSILMTFLCNFNENLESLGEREPQFDLVAKTTQEVEEQKSRMEIQKQEDVKRKLDIAEKNKTYVTTWGERQEAQEKKKQLRQQEETKRLEAAKLEKQLKLQRERLARQPEETKEEEPSKQAMQDVAVAANGQQVFQASGLLEMEGTLLQYGQTLPAQINAVIPRKFALKSSPCAEKPR